MVAAETRDMPKLPPAAPVKLEVDVKVGDEVFYVANDPALSIPILCSELAKMRGSDASGLHDMELPVEVRKLTIPPFCCRIEGT